jgi:hypothetical protein
MSVSKRKWFVILVVFVAIVSPCYAEDLYLNSACSSGCDGTTVEKGWAAPADIQWASSDTAGKVDAGDTLHIYGLHNTSLVIGASGNETDGVITIKFESGSSFEKAYWGYNDTTSAIYGVRNYITIDGNNVGVVKCTDNGWKKTYQQKSTGIFLTGDYNTIKNITVSDIYVFDSTAEDPDSGVSAMPIYTYGSHFNIYGNTVDHGWKAINLAYGDSEVDVNIYNNTISHCGVGISVGSAGGASNGLTGLKIYNNTISIGDNFCGSTVHQDGIHVFAKGGTAVHVTGLEIYNNIITRNVYCTGLSAYIYQEGNPGDIISPLIYNNVLYTTTGISGAHDGMIYTKNNTDPVFYNNTLYGAGTTHGILFGSTLNVTMKGNIIHSCDVGVTLGGSPTTITGAADNGSGLIRLTFSGGHGVGAAQIIQCIVSGVGGTTEANGTWKASYVDSTHLDLLGSTFANEYTSGGTMITGSITDSGDGSDYNDFYRAEGFQSYYLGASKTSLAAWQSATGGDANSLDSDPAFVSTSNYRLTASSPAAVRDSLQFGTFTTDIEGTTRSLYSMGAYEYGSSSYPSVSIGSGATMSIGSGATATLY